jgi:transcriptional regulator with XRE-family HTH domain
MGMEKLDTYLKTRNIRQADFAELLGIKQATVSRLKCGRGKPSRTLAVNIARVTDGAVPVEIWDAPHFEGAA